LFIPQGEAFLSRIHPSAVGSSLVLMMLITVIGYGGWSVLQEIQKVQFTPVDQAPGVTSTIAELDDSATITASLDDTVGFQSPSPDALDRLYRPQALDVPVLVARDGPISNLDPRRNGAFVIDQVQPLTDQQIANLPGTESTPPLPVPEDTPVQVVATEFPDVVLFAVRPSWVRVNAADGTVLFEKILDAGETYVLPKSEEPPLLRAGNAGSLYFAVNGENFGPAGTGPAVVKNVVLAPEKLRQVYDIADVDKDSDLADFVAFAQANNTAPDE